MQTWGTRTKRLFLAGAAILCLSGPAMAQNTIPGDVLNAALIDSTGKNAGKVTVRPATDGVLITLEAEGLKAGWHGFHVHGVGNCDDHAEHFKQAGGHLNDNDKHGFLNPEGPHKGDLPNIWAHADGTVKAEFYSEDLDVAELMDTDGSAFMIHDVADDYKTDPAGESGPRLVCGVVSR